MKVCTKCGIVKKLDEFHRQERAKDGRQCVCKICMCEWQAANKTKIAKYGKVYRTENKLKIVKRGKIYRAINKKKRADSIQGPALFDVYSHQLIFAEIVSRDINDNLLVPCTYCGKNHTPTKIAVCHRIAALNGKTRGECRFYCSETCKHACPSYGQIRYWKFQEPATSREVSAQFRQLILKRDNWTCQRCGAGVEAELHVHHIEGVVQHPGMANDLENGITFCKTCHKYVHSQAGCRYHEMRCPKK